MEVISSFLEFEFKKSFVKVLDFDKAAKLVLCLLSLDELIDENYDC